MPGSMKYRKRCPDYALSDGRRAGLERRATAGLKQPQRSSSPFWTATMSGCPQRRRSKWLFAKSGDRDFVAVDHMLTREEGQVYAYGLALHPPDAKRLDGPPRYRDERHPFDPYVGGEDCAWWLSTWNSVRKYRLPEPLIKYRVRRLSLSTGNPSKRRKACIGKVEHTAHDPLAASSRDLYVAQTKSAYLLRTGEGLGSQFPPARPSPLKYGRGWWLTRAEPLPWDS